MAYALNLQNPFEKAQDVVNLKKVIYTSITRLFLNPLYVSLI